jgi:hypothetical protein
MKKVKNVYRPFYVKMTSYGDGFYPVLFRLDDCMGLKGWTAFVEAPPNIQSIQRSASLDDEEVEKLFNHKTPRLNDFDCIYPVETMEDSEDLSNLLIQKGVLEEPSSFQTVRNKLGGFAYFLVDEE